MLSVIDIDIDHLLPYRKELNELVHLDIYRRYIIVTWVNPPGGLHTRMSFYATHFLEISDGIISHPGYLSWHWSHALWIALGFFRVGSHCLWA